jgi:hypothetical protein
MGRCVVFIPYQSSSGPVHVPCLMQSPLFPDVDLLSGFLLYNNLNILNSIIIIILNNSNNSLMIFIKLLELIELIKLIKLIIISLLIKKLYSE